MAETPVSTIVGLLTLTMAVVTFSLQNVKDTLRANDAIGINGAIVGFCLALMSIPLAAAQFVILRQMKLSPLDELLFYVFLVLILAALLSLFDLIFVCLSGKPDDHALRFAWTASVSTGMMLSSAFLAGEFIITSYPLVSPEFVMGLIVLLLSVAFGLGYLKYQFESVEKFTDWMSSE